MGNKLEDLGNRTISVSLNDRSKIFYKCYFYFHTKMVLFSVSYLSSRHLFYPYHCCPMILAEVTGGFDYFIKEIVANQSTTVAGSTGN